MKSSTIVFILAALAFPSLASAEDSVIQKSEGTVEVQSMKAVKIASVAINGPAAKAIYDLLEDAFVHKDGAKSGENIYCEKKGDEYSCSGIFMRSGRLVPNGKIGSFEPVTPANPVEQDFP